MMTFAQEIALTNLFVTAILGAYKKESNMAKNPGNTEIKIGKRKVKFKIIALVITLIVAVCMLIEIYQLYRYDQGVLEIYADQQDGYVELVMEQIALRDPDATDDQIIQQILGTLDASSGRYWTLSKDDYLVFVKDILETNRYKGFTTSTYFVDQNADNYLNTLRKNWVTHQLIRMNGDNYVASGVVFEYAGQEYRICLMTAADVILDNNAFLSAKITISIMLILIFVIILVTFMTFAVVMDKQREEAESLNSHIVEQNLKIGELDQEMINMEKYSTRWNAYNISVLQTFLEKLKDRGTYPILLKKIVFDKPKDRDEFLEYAQMLLDKKVLRFLMNDDNELVLLFLEYTDREANDAINRVQTYGGRKIVKEQTIASAADMEEIDREFFG